MPEDTSSIEMMTSTLKLIRCLLQFDEDTARLKKVPKKNVQLAKKITDDLRIIFGINIDAKVSELTDQKLSKLIENRLQGKLKEKKIKQWEEQKKRKKNIEKNVSQPEKITVSLSSLLNAAQRILQEHFIKEAKRFRKPLFGIGKEKSMEEFITYLNNEKNSFATLLGISLQCLFNVSPPRCSSLIPVKKLNTQTSALKQSIQKIKIPDDEVYQERLNILIEQDPIFTKYKATALADGFSSHQLTAAQLYRFYCRHDDLTVIDAKKLWPKLADYFQENDKIIKAFITSGADDTYIRTSLSTMMNPTNILQYKKDDSLQIAEKIEIDQKIEKEILPALREIHQKILHLKRGNAEKPIQENTDHLPISLSSSQ
jgi:hypothetical protein